MLTDFLFETDIDVVSFEDFHNEIPTIRNGVAYFKCHKKFWNDQDAEWELSEIGIPAKIWWRFLYQPKSTFVTWKMIS